MSESAATLVSGYLLALVALVLLLLIIPAASAASRRLKPGWRAWMWPLIFAGMALASLCAATAAAQNIQDTNAFIWKLDNFLAGVSFTFLALHTLYRAVPEKLARRFAPLIWAVYLVFTMGVMLVPSFVPVLIYDAACAVLVFLVHSTLYARDRDRAADALPIIIGTGLILVADLIASFGFLVSLGPLSFNQLFPFNLLVLVGLIFFFKGASASYGVKYDMQRSRERSTSSNT
jgi:hypothetical protein